MMTPIFIYCCMHIVGLYVTVICCETKFQCLKRSEKLQITSETYKENKLYQVVLNEVLSLPTSTLEFCLKREYIAQIEDTDLQHNSEYTMELLISMVQMRIEKVSCDSNLTVVAASNKSKVPMMLVERIKTLLLEAELDPRVTAGHWTVDNTCWKQNNRSLKTCGFSLCLQENLLKEPGDFLRLNTWIMEPVTSLGGKLSRLHIQLNPHFWFPAIAILANECCYVELHIIGTGWGNMTIQNQPRLKSLYLRDTFKDACRVNYSSISGLTSLSLPDTKMDDIPSGMKHLEELSVLDVSLNNLDTLPSNVLTSNNLVVLNVSDNRLQHLPFNITQLKHLRILEMSKNSISTQDLLDIAQLRNLEKLTLSSNDLNFVPKEISSIKKLKVLELNNNKDLSNIAYFNDNESYSVLEILKMSNTGYVMQEGIDILEKLNLLKYLDLSCNDRFIWAERPFRFLGGKNKLSFLNVSRIDMNISGLLGSEDKYAKFESLSNLKVLDASHCNLHFLQTIIFTKLESLENLNLSGNFLTNVPSNLLISLHRIKTINLSHNKISKDINMQLSPNSTVNVLNMSHNYLTYPGNIILSGSIVCLDLSSNYISTWNDPNVFSKPANWVKHINMSKNNIIFLTSYMRKSFEVLKSVSLGLNHLDCTNCEMKNTQKWLSGVGQNIVHEFTCDWPVKDKGKNVTDVTLNITDCTALQKNSQDPLKTLAIYIIAVIMVIIIALCTCHLRVPYILHILRVRQWHKNGCDTCVEKEYDAFVCYSGSDSTWVSNELSPHLEREPEKYKLCIHERDFPVGTFIMRNIDTAIKSSRYTIIVLSNKFLSSAWCRWELELTNYTMFDENRDLIIMIEIERLDQRKIPHYLQFLMKTRTYLEWPESSSSSQTSRDKVWRRLREALGESIYQKNKETNTKL